MPTIPITITASGAVDSDYTISFAAGTLTVSPAPLTITASNQTKVYGAALFRMRAEDFGEIQHQGGISPAWPISYADMEPYYDFIYRASSSAVHPVGTAGAPRPAATTTVIMR